MITIVNERERKKHFQYVENMSSKVNESGTYKNK